MCLKVVRRSFHQRQQAVPLSFTKYCTPVLFSRVGQEDGANDGVSLCFVAGDGMELVLTHVERPGGLAGACIVTGESDKDTCRVA